MPRISGHQVAVRGSGFRKVYAHPAIRHLKAELVLKPRDAEAALARVVQEGPLSQAEFHRRHGIPAQEAEDLRQWLARKGLAVRQEGLVFLLEGSLRQFVETFDMPFQVRDDGKRRHFAPVRDPELPEPFDAWVAGLVGVENLTRARPFFRTPTAQQVPGFWPKDIERAYRFPPQLDGSGVTIGILEFSNGYSSEDLAAFWQQAGVEPPTVDFCSVDGTPNDGGQNPWDMEATLDVEWAGALAPGARITVLEASAGSTDVAFGLSLLRAVRFALHHASPRPSVLSISYGDGETRFASATMQAWAALFFEGAMTGVTTFVASGDTGAFGLQEPGRLIPHVDAPANCPWVVAVGGTHLVVGPDGAIAQETGWTDIDNNGASGGGISQVFMVPPYQSALRLPLRPGLKPGRGVPDVAANADPLTGYAIVFQSQVVPVGGTSVAAPVWAALLARVTQGRHLRGLPPLGYLHPALYTPPLIGPLHDIVQGNNSYWGVEGYHCQPGWDAVTGWGSPDGQALFQIWAHLPPDHDTTPAGPWPPASAEVAGDGD
ncbi:MAG: peptidase [Firmicutes bacterium]|nr:peptidase [Alicyclobacillaceae bacterium]MCL6496084.1 peptidase [Bacillota bacterium]